MMQAIANIHSTWQSTHTRANADWTDCRSSLMGLTKFHNVHTRSYVCEFLCRVALRNLRKLCLN